MRFFTTAPAWQIFLFTFILPFFVGIFLYTLLIQEIQELMDPSTWHNGFSWWERFLITLWHYFRFIFLCVVITWVTWGIWMGSVIWQMGEKLPPAQRPNRGWGLFTVAFTVAIPVTYYALISSIVYGILHMQQTLDDFLDGIPLFFWLYALSPVLAIMACLTFIMSIVQCMRLINRVELAQGQRVSSQAGNFFLLLFHPIGIWIIQPILQRLSTPPPPPPHPVDPFLDPGQDPRYFV